MTTLHAAWVILIELTATRPEKLKVRSVNVVDTVESSAEDPGMIPARHPVARIVQVETSEDRRGEGREMKHRDKVHLAGAAPPVG